MRHLQHASSQSSAPLGLVTAHAALAACLVAVLGKVVTVEADSSAARSWQWLARVSAAVRIARSDRLCTAAWVVAIVHAARTALDRARRCQCLVSPLADHAIRTRASLSITDGAH